MMIIRKRDYLVALLLFVSYFDSVLVLVVVVFRYDFLVLVIVSYEYDSHMYMVHPPIFVGFVLGVLGDVVYDRW